MAGGVRWGCVGWGVGCTVGVGWRLTSAGTWRTGGGRRSRLYAPGCSPAGPGTPPGASPWGQGARAEQGLGSGFVPRGALWGPAWQSVLGGLCGARGLCSPSVRPRVTFGESVGGLCWSAVWGVFVNFNCTLFLGARQEGALDLETVHSQVAPGGLRWQLEGRHLLSSQSRGLLVSLGLIQRM